MDMWIGLNSIGIHYQYHWTDETPLDFTQWMEGAPDSFQPIDDPVRFLIIIIIVDIYLALYTPGGHLKASSNAIFDELCVREELPLAEESHAAPTCVHVLHQRWRLMTGFATHLYNKFIGSSKAKPHL